MSDKIEVIKLLRKRIDYLSGGHSAKTKIPIEKSFNLSLIDAKNIVDEVFELIEGNSKVYQINFEEGVLLVIKTLMQAESLLYKDGLSFTVKFVGDHWEFRVKFPK